MRSTYATAAAAIATAAVIASAARAQAPASKPTVYPIYPASRLTLTLDGWTRAETRANADFGTTAGNDPDGNMTRLRLGVGYALDRTTTLFAQPQIAYRRVSNGTPSANGTKQAATIHQGYADLGNAGSRWRLGRQEMSYGDQRLIGAAAWFPEGRSFDAARWRSALSSAGSVDLFAGKLGDAPNKTNNPTLAGAYATVSQAGKAAAGSDLYLLFKADRTSGENVNVWTLGARPHATFARGFDGTLEAGTQWGDGTKGRAIRDAWAYAGSLAYTLPGSAAVRFLMEFDAASGGDPTDAHHIRTFDQLFPTNHFHYGTGDFVGWKNMEDTRLAVTGKPGRSWGANAEGHRFRLRDGKDFWYSDSGQPVKGPDGKPLRSPDGSAGRDLGSEFDLYLTYAPRGHAAFAGGYSRFLPGEYVKNVLPGGASRASDWFYLQMNLGL
jgi:hypothetical protein